MAEAPRLRGTLTKEAQRGKKRAIDQEKISAELGTLGFGLNEQAKLIALCQKC